MMVSVVGKIFQIQIIEKEQVQKKLALAISEKDNQEDMQFLLISEISTEDCIEIKSADLESGTLSSGYVQLKVISLHFSNIVSEIAVVNSKTLDKILKKLILRFTTIHFHAVHSKNIHKKFIPNESKISYAGRVFDQEEICNLVDSSLEFWLTTGRYAEEFEKKFSEFFDIKNCSLVNSGSSANLIAFSALTSPSLKERQIKKGDEVITVAAGFPTTVNPILQYGAVPVFVDVTLPTYNIDVTQLESALSSKTKAIMIAHSLGNPFDLQSVKDFCDKHGLWLIEDNCDALGSRYKYNGEWKYTGTIGDIGTSSFYPPHHLTMGEGGAVYTNSNKLKKIIESFRDWGRDCFCPSGCDDTCGKRFNWTLGELPKGYDHKYIYSHLGYNLKVTDMQAAIGVAQLKKFPKFIEKRKQNWKRLRDGLNEYSEQFILPESTPNSDPSWFGFLLTVRDSSKLSRKEIVSHLESNKIQTRMLFAGNYLRHPVFNSLRETNAYRVVGQLKNTDKIMNDTFWLGVYPGMNEDMIDYMLEKLKQVI